MRKIKRFLGFFITFVIMLSTVAWAASVDTSQTLASGSSGTQVRYLQLNLNGMNYYSGTPDGDYGSNTVKAVKNYQSANGLSADGMAGPKTLRALENDVKNVQQALSERGYYSGDIDGIFGSDTTSSVKKFQRDNGLSADGIVGPDTKSKLFDSNSNNNSSSNIKGSKTISNGTYKIFTKLNNDVVVDVSEGSTRNGANIQLWQKNNVEQQIFKIKYLNNGFYSIVAVHSDKSIDVDNAGKDVGTNVQQYEQNGTDAQQWCIQDAGNGYYYIISKCNGLYLDASNGDSHNGTNIWMYSGNGTDSQKWRFESPDSSSSNGGNQDKINRFIEIARGEVGTAEGRNNDTKYGRWYGMNNQPWCVIFTNWVANEAGITLENGSKSTDSISIRRTASSSDCYKWCKNNGRFTTTPEPGCLFFIKNTGSDRSTYPAEHTGIVVAVNGNTITTVEGNTTDGSFEGVCKKTRNINSSSILGYGLLHD